MSEQAGGGSGLGREAGGLGRGHGPRRLHSPLHISLAERGIEVLLMEPRPHLLVKDKILPTYWAVRAWRALVSRDPSRQLLVWADTFDDLEDYQRHVWRVE